MKIYTWSHIPEHIMFEGPDYLVVHPSVIKSLPLGTRFDMFSIPVVSVDDSERVRFELLERLFYSSYILPEFTPDKELTQCLQRFWSQQNWPASQ